jgi:hypothetical protein
MSRPWTTQTPKIRDRANLPEPVDLRATENMTPGAKPENRKPKNRKPEKPYRALDAAVAPGRKVVRADRGEVP